MSISLDVESFNAFKFIPSLPHVTVVTWLPPKPGTIKINTDGSCFGTNGWGAFGGLARDPQGKWIEGFCGRIGYAPPLQAELWGIRHAAKLAGEKGCLEAVIESDCNEAVQAINNKDVMNHPERALLQDCIRQVDGMVLEVVFIHREGNKCVDYLAKIGQQVGEQKMRIMVPIDEFIVLLNDDVNGNSRNRRE